VSSSSKLEFNSEVTKNVTTRGQLTTVAGSIGVEASGGGYVRTGS